MSAADDLLRAQEIALQLTLRALERPGTRPRPCTHTEERMQRDALAQRQHEREAQLDADAQAGDIDAAAELLEMDERRWGRWGRTFDHAGQRIDAEIDRRIEERCDRRANP